MIDQVRSCEAKQPLQIPVGLAATTGAPDSAIYDSKADWVAPFARLSPSMTYGKGSPACKMNVNDSNHRYFGAWLRSPISTTTAPPTF